MSTPKRKMRALLDEVRRAGTAEKLANEDATSIGDAVAGAIVRVVGRIVVGAGAVVSPATEERGVWFRTQCLVNSPQGDEVNEERVASWDLVFDETFGDRFEIDDGTARAMIACEGAHVVTEMVDVTRVFAESGGGEELRAHLAAHGTSFSWKAMRVFQWALREGDLVEVIGTAAFQATEAAGYRSPPTRMLVLSADSEQGAMLRVRKVGT